MFSIRLNQTPKALSETHEWPTRNVALCLHFLRHLGVIVAIVYVPLSKPLCLLLIIGFVVRMWAMEAVNHRYFAHRSYRTSRLFQFALALLAAQAACRGPLWWAYIHRRHHRHPDTAADLHSPVTHSFIHAYFLWLTVPANRRTDLSQVADFAKYPELRWLNKHCDDAAFALGAALLTSAGYFGWLGSSVDAWSALLWGVCAPAVLVLHLTGLLSTLCHLRTLPGGYRRFHTCDESINRPVLALFTLGAGYHNNHHRFPAYAKTSFAWYEIDLCYEVLRILERVGLIWDVRVGSRNRGRHSQATNTEVIPLDASLHTTWENV